MNSKTKPIKNIVTDVFQSLQPTLDWDWNKAFEEAIGVGMRLENIKYEREKVVELKYKGHYVGETKVNFLVHLGQEKIMVRIDRVYGRGSWRDDCTQNDREIKRVMKELGVKVGLIILYGKFSKSQKELKLEMKEIGA